MLVTMWGDGSCPIWLGEFLQRCAKMASLQPRHYAGLLAYDGPWANLGRSAGAQELD